jgi:hypothetical protein
MQMDVNDESHAPHARVDDAGSNSIGFHGFDHRGRPM